MKLTGKLTGIRQDYLTGNFEITLAVRESKTLTDGYDGLATAELLDVKLDKHRQRRSLDANAYFHVLVGKLAEAVGTSKVRTKNLMIFRYGQPLYLDDDKTAPAVIKTNIPAELMLEDMTEHWMPVRQTREGNTDIVFYMVYRGSHTYDSKEMATLIDGTVSECQDLGIETIPPEELERMKRGWKA